MRCVVIDVGNTSTGIGLFDSGKVSRVTHLKGGIAKQPDACAEAVRKAARGTVNGAVLGSVVPRVNSAWKRLILNELGCDLLAVKAGLPPYCHLVRPEQETS